MTGNKQTVLATTIVVTLLVAPVRAEPPSRPEVGGHRHLIDEHKSLPPSHFGGAPPGARRGPSHILAERSHPIVTRDVLGYLPYWSYPATQPYVPPRWDLLTILAWFAVDMDANGNITKKNGWGDATTRAIVADAHAHGVTVVVTVTNFHHDDIASIVGSAANRARAIDSCIALLAEQPADGINVDFELVPKSARADFVTFMTELTDAVRASAPNGGPGHVSLAGPAIDRTGAYDFEALLENTDGIMVMAYGYHWRRSKTSGPISPLSEGDLWKTRSVSWSIHDYLEYGGVDHRGKIFIGLPWYGRSYEVAARVVPSPALSHGVTRTFKVAEPEALELGKEWEEVSKSTYYYKSSDGTLSQVWYDDRRAFEHKIGYVDAMGLGGIGIWALGYEGDSPALWDAIDKVFAGASPDFSPDLRAKPRRRR